MVTRFTKEPTLKNLFNNFKEFIYLEKYFYSVVWKWQTKLI